MCSQELRIVENWWNGLFSISFGALAFSMGILIKFRCARGLGVFTEGVLMLEKKLKQLFAKHRKENQKGVNREELLMLVDVFEVAVKTLCNECWCIESHGKKIELCGCCKALEQIEQRMKDE